MKTIQVTIEGISPLLMNSPKSMIDEKSGLTKKTEKYDIKGEAEKCAYRKENKELYVPAEAIKGCIIDASSYKKFGRYSAKPILAGGVFITPNEIGLGVKHYEIDVRTVVIQRNRVIKGRPMIKKWKLNFTINYDETLISDGSLIKPILEEGGKRVGILDFRPIKFGSFGMFKIIKWQEK